MFITVHCSDNRYTDYTIDVIIYNKLPPVTVSCKPIPPNTLHSLLLATAMPPLACASRNACSSYRYVVMNSGKSLFVTTSSKMPAAVTIWRRSMFINPLSRNLSWRNSRMSRHTRWRVTVEDVSSSGALCRIHCHTWWTLARCIFMPKWTGLLVKFIII